jgi:hypothetical protein
MLCLMRAASLLLVVAGCATGVPSTATDAPPTPGPDGRELPTDGSTFLDAPIAIDAPPQVVCTSSATCAAASQLGSVSGDTGSTMVEGSGYQSAWYQVRVSEDDSGVFGVPMNVTVNLTSPAGINYDLYAYVNTGTDVVECAAVSGSSTSAGTSDSVHLSWGETGFLSNGSNDDRTLSIEVRYVSGTCSAGKPFQLVVHGNQ